MIASQEIQQLLSDYQPLFDSLTEYTGNTVEDFDDVQDVFSTLKAEVSARFLFRSCLTSLVFCKQQCRLLFGGCFLGRI